MKLVVDASVAVKWFLVEPHSIRAGRLRDARFSLVAPDLIRLELGNVLWKHVRRGELTSKAAESHLEAFEMAETEIRQTSGLVAVAFHLAVALDRTVYDCLYLALAVEENCALITADRKFHAAVAKSQLAPYILWIEDM